jgi:lambda family phage portal protein
VVTNGYAANACEAFAANLVGDGIKPSSLIGDADLRDRVQRLWLAWTDEADADGLTDFYGLQAMVAREMFVAGECFVRLRPRRAEDGLLVPLQLQLLQSEMLPFEKTETAANGNRIRCGIEFDAIGRRVAYHFRRRHPGDSTDQGAVIPETVRVPAADVLHIYRPIDAGQIRGLPHIAPAMVRLFLLDQYDDAELDRKKTAAMFAGFITKTAPEEPMMGEAEADLDGAAIASLEPGTMQVLLPGEDVKFSSPADVGGGYEAFQYRTLLAVSASLGLPYHLVTGDVRQANYSSLRAELVEFRRRIGQLQHGVIVHQLCRAVWQRWLETAVLSGALDADPAAVRPVQWIPPRWDWVDPLKDIQAQVLAMEAGITSRRKVVEATGYDIEEVDRENAADAARATGLGLRYRTSPGETQGARATPATRPEPGDGAGNDTDDGARRPIRPPNRSDDMASWYAIRARGTGAEVAIYDEIGAYGVSAKGFLAELGALPEGTPVDLRLNSPGGSVFDAVAIHNALKRHEGTVTVWIDGIAASAASYIAMAGDEIVMPENAFLMIHDPAGLVMGTAEDMRAMAEALDKVKGSLVSGYAAKSGRTPEEVSALMAAETWFDAGRTRWRRASPTG